MKLPFELGWQWLLYRYVDVVLCVWLLASVRALFAVLHGSDIYMPIGFLWAVEDIFFDARGTVALHAVKFS